MAGPIAESFVALRADDKKFRGDVSRMGGQAGTSSGKSFARKFAGALAGLAATLGVSKFFKSAITGASDLEESINAVNVVFEGNAAGILQIGETAATTFGVTREQFNTAAVSFANFSSTVAEGGHAFDAVTGEVLDQVGATEQLIGRSTDFASVMNLDVADAQALFQSGLAGQSRPLREYGIDISAAAVNTFAYANGIAEAGTELTEAQKVQARYGLIMQETDKVAGDFANTSDGLANGMRILKATASEAAVAFGTGLLPAAQSAVGGISETLTELGDRLPALGESVGEALTPAFEALGPALGAAIDAFIPILDSIGETFGALAPLLTPIVDLFGTMAGLIAGALGSAFKALSPVINIVAFFIQGFADTLGRLLTPIIEALIPVLERIAAVFGEALTAVLPIAINLFETLAGIVGPIIQLLAELFADVLEAVLPVVTNLFETLGPVIEEIAEALGEALAEALPPLVEVFQELMDILLPFVPLLADGLLVVLETLVPILPELIQGFIALKIATKGFAIAQAALNLILRANPIVLVGTALAGLAIGVKMAYDRFEPFRNIVDAAWQTLQRVWDTITEVGLAVFQAMTKVVGDVVDSVRDFLTTNEVVQQVVDFFEREIGRWIEIGQGVITFFKSVFTGQWSAAWEALKGIVGVVIDAVVDRIQTFGPLILQGLVALGGLLLEVGRLALTSLLDGIVAAWPTVRDWFTGLPGLIGGLIVDAAGWLIGKGQEVLAGIVTGLENAWPFIRDWFTGLPGLIGNVIWDAAGWLVSKGRDVLGGILAGVEEAWPDIRDWFAGLPGRVADAIQFIMTGLGTLGMRGWDMLRAILSGVEEFLPNVVSWFAGLPGKIAEAIQFIATGLGTLGLRGWHMLKAVLSGVEEFLPSILSWFASLPGKIAEAISFIATGLGKLGMRGWHMLKAVLSGVEEFLPRVTGWFAALPGKIAEAIQFIATGLGTLGMKGWDMLKAILGGVTEFWPEVSDWFADLPGRIADAIQFIATGLGTLGVKGWDLLNAVWSGIKKIWEDHVLGWLQALPGNIGAAIVEFASDLLSAGGQLMAQLWQGLVDWATENIPGAGRVLRFFGIDIPEEINSQLSEIDNLILDLAFASPFADEAFVDEFVADLGLTGTAGGERLADALNAAFADNVFSADEDAEIRELLEELLEGAAEGGSGTFVSVLSAGLDKGQVKVLKSIGELVKKAGDDADTKLKPTGTDLITGLRKGMDQILVRVRVMMVGLSIQFVRWLGSLRRTLLPGGLALMGGLAEGMNIGRLAVSLVLIRMRPLFAGWLGDLRGRLLANGLALMFGLRSGINLGAVAVAAAIRNVRAALAGWLGDTSRILYTAGWWAIRGFYDGVRAADDVLWHYLRNLGHAISSAVGDQSKALYWRGAELIDGLIRGVKDRISRLQIQAIALMSFARGGIVPGTGPQMAVVHGGELILNAKQQAAIASLGTGVTRWQSIALAALRHTAQSSRWLLDLLTQMKHESGGNPSAVNRWDINWFRGHPSMGLMQVIGPTFRAYAKDLFERGILDPLANIVAAIRYTVSRYGDLGAWRRRGFRGYEHGGIVPGVGPQWAVVHGGERVLTAEQQRQLGAINVEVTFAGALPTERQAYTTGQQVGRGIQDELERQRIRTLVRSA